MNIYEYIYLVIICRLLFIMYIGIWYIFIYFYFVMKEYIVYKFLF